MIAQYCKATIECTGEAVSLLLVSSGLATTTGSLELASPERHKSMKRSKLERVADYFKSLLAPGSHEGLDMAAGTTSSAKVLLSLTGLAGSWQGEDNKTFPGRCSGSTTTTYPGSAEFPFQWGPSGPAGQR